MAPANEATPATDFQYNPEDSEYTRDPYPTYAHMREHAPAYHWAPLNAWIFSRHSDVVSLMRDTRFTFEFGQWEFAPPGPMSACPEYEEIMKRNLFVMPPEHHARLRKLANPAFTPRALERTRARIQAIVDERLEELASGDTLDMAVFADPIPIAALGVMLGIPREQQDVFRQLGISVIMSADFRITPDERTKILAPFPAGLRLLRQLIDERRANPTEDMLGALVQPDERGESLSSDDVVSLVVALLAGASEPTRHFLSFAIWTLLRHPDELAALRREPTLMRNALDEVLRFENAAKLGVPRFAREDVELRGVTVRKGQVAFPLLPAALRDGAVFRDPDRFDIRRDQTQNVVFGSGPHVCIGAAVARLEGQIAVGTLVQRYPKLELAGEPTFVDHPFLRKMSSLPLRLS